MATDAGLLGMYLDSAARLDEAEPKYQRALALTGSLLATDASNARAKILLAEAARNRAANRLRANAPGTAREAIDRAVEVYEAMQRAGQLPDGVKWRMASAHWPLCWKAFVRKRPMPWQK